MGTQRVFGLGAAALAAGLLLAGCGGSSGGAGTIPKATLTGTNPPAGSTPDGSESADPGSSGSAPKVSSPIEASAFTGDACAALSASSLSSLGLAAGGTARESATGPSCYWKFTDEDTNRVDISAAAKNPNGLSDIYDQKSEFAYFEEAQVGGHPAVFASPADLRTSGDCSLYVGLSDQFAVKVGAKLNTGADQSRSCQVTERVAEAMVETLKGS